MPSSSSRVARSFRADVRRFSYLINTDQVFGTHNGPVVGSVPCTPKVSATRLATPRRICLIGGIRRKNRGGPMATGKQLKAAVPARRGAKGPRKKRTRPKPRQYTIADFERPRDRGAAAGGRNHNDPPNNP